MNNINFVRDNISQPWSAFWFIPNKVCGISLLQIKNDEAEPITGGIIIDPER